MVRILCQISNTALIGPFSSRAFDEVRLFCQADPARHAVASYYVSFGNDKEGRDEEVLRAVVSQLCREARAIPQAVRRLYEKREGGRAPFISALGSLVQQFQHTFIFVDALDEYPDIERLIGLLKNICGPWESGRIHVFVTSRKQQDIEEGLKLAFDNPDTIDIQATTVYEDIEAHVQNALGSDMKLRRCSGELKEHIRSSLMSRAQGMYVISAFWPSLLLELISTQGSV